MTGNPRDNKTPHELSRMLPEQAEAYTVPLTFTWGDSPAQVTFLFRNVEDRDAFKRAWATLRNYREVTE